MTIKECFELADAAQKNGKAEDFIHYLGILVDYGVKEMMPIYCNAWFSEEYHNFCNTEKALRCATLAADEGDSNFASKSTYLFSVLIQIDLENNNVDKAVENYLIRNKYKRQALQSNQSNIIKAVNDNDLKLGSFMCETAVDYDKKGDERKYITLLEHASDISAKAIVLYAIHLIEHAEKASGNMKFEKHKEARKYLLEAIKMDGLNDAAKGFAYATLANYCRIGLDEKEVADVNKAYEYDCLAAKLGNEDAIGRLPRYKKKIFGGYSFK